MISKNGTAPIPPLPPTVSKNGTASTNALAN
jgi:hypothetical protein